MKNLNPREQPPQEVPIILDQMTRDEWILELERASDRIEDGLISIYRGYRSMFIRLNSRWMMFQPNRKKTIENYLKRRVIFPLLSNLQLQGSHHVLERFAHDLLYTAVKNFAIQAQVQEASQRVKKEIQRQDQKTAVKKLFGRMNNKSNNGSGRR